MIRTGLIGLGRISNMHFSSILSLNDNFELTAVCDIDPQKLEYAKNEYGIEKLYTDYKEMLDKESLDLAVVATPNGLHYEMGMEILKRKIHLLMEKPITTSVEDAEKLILEAEKNNKHFFAVKQVRFNPAIQILKKTIEEGKLGKIYSAALVVRWRRPQEYFSESDWRGTKKLDGGTLLNQGIHYIDILVWMINSEIESVFGKIDTVAHDIEIEDEAFGLIKFKNKIYATVEFNINTYPKNLECSLTILGTKGSVKLSGSAMNKIELWEVENFPKPEIQEGFEPNVYANGMYQGSCPNHIYIYKNLANVLNKHTKDYIDGAEALKSLKVVKAIYESSEKEKEIRNL